MSAELEKHQENSSEQLESITQLQNKLAETEMVRGFTVFTSSISFFLVLMVSCFLRLCRREEKQKNFSGKG